MKAVGFVVEACSLGCSLVVVGGNQGLKSVGFWGTMAGGQDHG